MIGDNIKKVILSIVGECGDDALMKEDETDLTEEGKAFLVYTEAVPLPSKLLNSTITSVNLDITSNLSLLVQSDGINGNQSLSSHTTIDSNLEENLLALNQTGNLPI